MLLLVARAFAVDPDIQRKIQPNRPENPKAGGMLAVGLVGRLVGRDRSLYPGMHIYIYGIITDILYIINWL